MLHGGGNTSVKAQATTLFGETVDVLYVKGIGLGPRDDRAARVIPPCAWRRSCGSCELPTMSDEQMVNELRLAAARSRARPTPSVETLLHAALPAKFIDHTHADALLAVVDQHDARAIVRARSSASARSSCRT